MVHAQLRAGGCALQLQGPGSLNALNYTSADPPSVLGATDAAGSGSGVRHEPRDDPSSALQGFGSKP